MLPLNGIRDSKNLLKLAGCCLLVLMMSGCGRNASNSSATTSKGVFVDSPVEGLNYKTDTLKGITGPNGEFQYHTGEMVVFSIGDVVIGSAVGDAIITPLHLGPQYSYADNTGINISRFLQSLDADGVLDNGIQITPEIREEMKGRIISFAKPTAEFEDDNIKSLFGALNTKSVFTFSGQGRLKTELEARTHLIQSLKNLVRPPALPLFSSPTMPPVFHRISTSFYPAPFPVITSVRIYIAPLPFHQITSMRTSPSTPSTHYIESGVTSTTQRNFKSARVSR